MIKNQPSASFPNQKPDKACAGIMLAAGQSLRFGSPKQLLLVNDRPLICWSLEAALKSGLAKIYLVLGHLADRIAKAVGYRLSSPKLEIVYNPDYRQGMGSSLARAVQAAGPGWRAYMVLLADQPMLPASLIDTMLEALSAGRHSIVIPSFRGRRGNPVLFGAKWYAELCKLGGDVGGRPIVAANPEEVIQIEVKNQACLEDIDCPADLMRLRTRLPASGEVPASPFKQIKRP